MKVKLLGVAQNPKHSVFQLEKKKQTIDAIRSFLGDLGFASWDTSKILGPIGGADTGRPTIKYSNLLYDDKYYAMQRGQYTVEVFFGKKKIILSVLTLNDERQLLHNKILLYCVPSDAQ